MEYTLNFFQGRVSLNFFIFKKGNHKTLNSLLVRGSPSTYRLPPPHPTGVVRSLSERSPAEVKEKTVDCSQSCSGARRFRVDAFSLSFSRGRFYVFALAKTLQKMILTSRK